MDENPWLLWLLVTLLGEAVFFWFIRKSKSDGAISSGRLFGRSEHYLVRSKDPELFDRMIKLYYCLAALLPFFAYFIVFNVER